MIRSIFNGLVGACTLSLAHQVLKRIIPDAPRLDYVGKQGLQKLLSAVGISANKEETFLPALIGVIASNTLYFSQVGEKAGLLTILRGITLGATAGYGAAILPDKIGVDGATSLKTSRIVVLTISLYTLGGLATALAAQLTKKSSQTDH